MRHPKPLKKGDHITIVAPAKQIDATNVQHAKTVLESAGYFVSISKHCLGQHNYFSGSQKERLDDLQFALNDPSVRAILCARGGYGCVQLVDEIDWSLFNQNPKWVIGFSDITVLHQHLQKVNIASIHGTMPLNFQDNSERAISSFLQAVDGSAYSLSSPSSTYNCLGQCEGVLMGGNLAIITSLIGTNDQPDYTNNILFVEEIGEPLYSIDRMFYSLKKGGILDKIGGLIIGGMTGIKDSEVPYGSSLEEIILTHVQHLEIPVAFDFPAGHINDNQALIFGAKTRMNVEESGGSLHFDKRQ